MLVRESSTEDMNHWDLPKTTAVTLWHINGKPNEITLTSCSWFSTYNVYQIKAISLDAQSSR